MDLVVLLFRLLVTLVLTIAFAVLAFLSLRISADGRRATALSARVAARASRGPTWLRGNEWAYSATAVRWWSLDVGLASLNFVLIAVHLTALVFISFGCFLLSVLAASVVGFNYVAQQKGLMGAFFRVVRFWEILAWLLIILYTAGVLLLAKVTLRY